MATFSAFPPQVHDTIAKNCQNSDLINLCCTSRWVKALYSRILYRNVDLRPNQGGLIFMMDERKRQDQFFQSLLANPEYGKFVRYFRAVLHTPKFHDGNTTLIPDAEMWRAMQLLTHVQTVDMGSRNDMAYCTMVPTRQFSNRLFHSATSVTLVGRMPYGLAKCVLDAVNPATLRYLCLDMVQEWNYGHIPHTYRPHTYMPGDKKEDGRIMAYGATSGLLTTLTGRCTGLQTLILRRVGQTHIRSGWHMDAEELIHDEWADFICSVHGTVEKFTFELAEEMEATWLTCNMPAKDPVPFRIADERFHRIILSAIMAGFWPCLNIIELKGVRFPDGQVGIADLKEILILFLGGPDPKIVVEENSHYVEDEYLPDEVFAGWFSSDDSESEMSS